MLKYVELGNRESCLNKAAADEPVFVLRANDPVAAQAIRHWATMATAYHEQEKTEEALRVADQFETWRREKTAVPAPTACAQINRR